MPDRRQPGQVGELLELVGHERRVQRLTGIGGELEPRPCPVLARCVPFLVVAPPMRAQHLDQDPVCLGRARPVHDRGRCPLYVRAQLETAGLR